MNYQHFELNHCVHLMKFVFFFFLREKTVLNQSIQTIQYIAMLIKNMPIHDIKNVQIDPYIMENHIPGNKKRLTKPILHIQTRTFYCILACTN